MRRESLAKIAWVSSLGKGARLYRLTVAWVDAAEIRRRPNRIREEAGFLPAPARSYGRRRICRRRTMGVRVPVCVLLRRQHEPWRGKVQAGPAFCLAFPCRETGSAK